METAAVRARTKAKLERKDYIDSFARLVSAFASSKREDILADAPAKLVSEFDAARAELWLWDSSSDSAYLVHSAGQKATRREEYVSASKGVISTVGQSRQSIESIGLSTFGGDDHEFAQRTGLSHISCYPMFSGDQDKVVAILAGYSKTENSDALRGWWKTYCEMCSIKVLDLLSAEEHKKQITQLSLLFEATRLLNSTLDLAELLELILKIARQEAKADRGSVFLVDALHNQLWSIVASGLDHEEIRVPYGTGVAGRVAQTGEVINTGDAYQLEYFDSSFDQRFKYQTRSLLSLPIRHHTGEIVGVIQLLNKIGGPVFTHEDEDFLMKLSGHMAMALDNAQLHRDQLIKQRLEKELALARDIQRSLLPESPPVVPGFEIAVANEPCFEVGGDYYDFLTLGPHSLLLVVADVEGKGVASAMVMSNLQATLRALVVHLHSLEVLATSLNEMIFNDTKSEKYLSCFLGLVDTRRNGLHYINAGHVPPMLVRGDASGHELLEEGGTVIGLFGKAEYRRGTLNFAANDVLICCTDGIMEACDDSDDEYGKERLVECVSRNRHMTAQEIVDAVLAEVSVFATNRKYSDDKVLMVMKVSPEGKLQSGRIPVPPPGGVERRDAPREN